MSLQGLPDFHKPLTSDGLQIFYPYEDSGTLVFMPDGLKLAERSDGSPDFMLSLVRGLSPALPPAPHGMLDFKIMPSYRMDLALSIIRENVPGAVIEPATFSSGWLVIQALGSSDLPNDMRAPIQMTWNGLGVARSTLKVSAETAAIIKQSLASQILSLRAYAQIELSGVSPRIPIKVRFDPAELMEVLASALGNENRIVPLSLVLEFFMRDLNSLPIEFSGDLVGVDRRELSETITDRLIDRFCSFTMPPDGLMEPHISLPSKGKVERGTFEWDLSEPLEVKRASILNLSSLEAVGSWIKEHNLDKIYQEVVVPVIKTGFLPISISSNLPDQMVGVLMIGVNIKAPSNMPYRPQALNESAELNPPDYSARVVLRLSPAERPEYSFQTFAVVKDGDGPKELSGPEVSHSGDMLMLDPDDFPISFMTIGANADLLGIADIRGKCSWSSSGGTADQLFSLSLNQPSAAIAVPRHIENPVIEVEAHPVDGSGILKIGPVRSKTLMIERYSFREYGPHRIVVECIFEGDENLYAIDLLPEAVPEIQATVQHFTASQPKREWSYVANSPFHGGYRYREHRSSDQPQAIWSDIRSAFENLMIQVPDQKLQRG
jgi:hypothetical protein